MNKIYIGIDASIKCTGIVIYKDNNYYFYYYNSDKVVNKRKLVKDNFLFNFNSNIIDTNDNILIVEDKNDLSNILLFDNITDKILDIINTYDETGYELIIGMEGYSFASTGKLYDIGEFCGMLKFKLYKRLKNLKTFYIFKPSNVKKFATGNGRAKKDLMLKTFREINSNTTNSLLDIFNINNNEYVKNSKAPIEDLVDAYFICKKIIITEL